jgi:transposase
LAAGCFAALVDDLRLVLRQATGRSRQPRAAILERRTLQSPPESGRHAGSAGAKHSFGRKGHAAVDTLGNLLALLVTPANAQDRAHVGALAAAVHEVTGQTVEVALVEQAYTGDLPAAEAQQHGIQLAVVKLPEAKRGFVLLPRRWVVERAFAWTARFRRLVRDDERLPATLAGLHLIVFACLMLHQWMAFASP